MLAGDHKVPIRSEPSAPQGLLRRCSRATSSARPVKEWVGKPDR